MSTLTRRDRGLIPEIFDLFEAPLFGLRPMSHSLRFEQFVKEGRYVLRAELPGVDPAKDVEVTVGGGILTIHAQRHQEETDTTHTEFRYGTLTRSVNLPANADEKDVTAAYDKGILEVSVNLTEAKEPGTRIPITTPKG
ncbi:Hsp20/alpha crystallin family protein [Acrocarpospora catenulata]|uniref:Hsp20/alpha crystallin family protein n=1 Tax=Acrocarpospora catenulata TaxID=2836182 RepID=UPI001BDB1D0A|nr:Hsp20/alpha crystallin family protein [Acrocarpospora catenulata]